jgi:hypothetical protein
MLISTVVRSLSIDTCSLSLKHDRIIIIEQLQTRTLEIFYKKKKKRKEKEAKQDKHDNTRIHSSILRFICKRIKHRHTLMRYRQLYNEYLIDQ